MKVKGKRPKLLVPQSLIKDVIAENHNPIFMVQPGSKRTLEVISLRFGGRKCDKA